MALSSLVEKAKERESCQICRSCGRGCRQADLSFKSLTHLAWCFDSDWFHCSSLSHSYIHLLHIWDLKGKQFSDPKFRQFHIPL